MLRNRFKSRKQNSHSTNAPITSTRSVAESIKDMKSLSGGTDFFGSEIYKRVPSVHDQERTVSNSSRDFLSFVLAEEATRRDCSSKGADLNFSKSYTGVPPYLETTCIDTSSLPGYNTLSADAKLRVDARAHCQYVSDVKDNSKMNEDRERKLKMSAIAIASYKAHFTDALIAKANARVPVEKGLLHQASEKVRSVFDANKPAIADDMRDLLLAIVWDNSKIDMQDLITFVKLAVSAMDEMAGTKTKDADITELLFEIILRSKASAVYADSIVHMQSMGSAEDRADLNKVTTHLLQVHDLVVKKQLVKTKKAAAVQQAVAEGLVQYACGDRPAKHKVEHVNSTVEKPKPTSVAFPSHLSDKQKLEKMTTDYTGPERGCPVKFTNAKGELRFCSQKHWRADHDAAITLQRNLRSAGMPTIPQTKKVAFANTAEAIDRAVDKAVKAAVSNDRRTQSQAARPGLGKASFPYQPLVFPPRGRNPATPTTANQVSAAAGEADVESTISDSEWSSPANQQMQSYHPQAFLASSPQQMQQMQMQHAWNTQAWNNAQAYNAQLAAMGYGAHCNTAQFRPGQASDSDEVPGLVSDPDSETDQVDAPDFTQGDGGNIVTYFGGFFWSHDDIDRHSQTELSRRYARQRAAREEYSRTQRSRREREHNERHLRGDLYLFERELGRMDSIVVSYINQLTADGITSPTSVLTIQSQDADDTVEIITSRRQDIELLAPVTRAQIERFRRMIRNGHIRFEGPTLPSPYATFANNPADDDDTLGNVSDRTRNSLERNIRYQASGRRVGSLRQSTASLRRAYGIEDPADEPTGIRHHVNMFTNSAEASEEEIVENLFRIIAGGTSMERPPSMGGTSTAKQSIAIKQEPVLQASSGYESDEGEDAILKALEMQNSSAKIQLESIQNLFEKIGDAIVDGNCSMRESLTLIAERFDSITTRIDDTQDMLKALVRGMHELAQLNHEARRTDTERFGMLLKSIACLKETFDNNRKPSRQTTPVRPFQDDRSDAGDNSSSKSSLDARFARVALAERETLSTSKSSIATSAYAMKLRSSNGSDIFGYYSSAGGLGNQLDYHASYVPMNGMSPSHQTFPIVGPLDPAVAEESKSIPDVNSIGECLMAKMSSARGSAEALRMLDSGASATIYPELEDHCDVVKVIVLDKVKPANNPTIMFGGDENMQKPVTALVHSKLFGAGMIVKGMKQTLISVSKMGDIGLDTLFTRGSCFVYDRRTLQIVHVGSERQGLYYLDDIKLNATILDVLLHPAGRQGHQQPN